MNLTDLLYDAPGRTIFVFLTIYFAMNCFLLYRLFSVKEEKKLYFKKMVLIFAFFFLMGVQELVFYYYEFFNDSLSRDISILSLKMFICTSLLVVVLFQSIGFLQEGIGICLQYLGVLYLIILIMDLVCYFCKIHGTYYTLLLSILLVLLLLFLFAKFSLICLRRYEAIIQTLSKGNLINALSVFGLELFTSYIVFLSVTSHGNTVACVTSLTLVLMLHLLFVYNGCSGSSFRHTYYYRHGDTSQMCLREERISEDYKIIQRLILYFESDKPYLDCELKLGDVSKHIYTNKTYLSRALNFRMSKNFNQFVNYYRIREACRMYIENPLIKVNELCDKSGFKNISSFSNAFHLNVRYTPAEWCKEVKRKLNNKEHVSVEDYFI